MAATTTISGPVEFQRNLEENAAKHLSMDQSGGSIACMKIVTAARSDLGVVYFGSLNIERVALAAGALRRR